MWCRCSNMCRFSACLSVCLISGKQSASLLIRTLIDWSCCQIHCLSDGSLTGDRFNTHWPWGEKGHEAGAPAYTDEIIEGVITLSRVGSLFPSCSWQGCLSGRGEPLFCLNDRHGGRIHKGGLVTVWVSPAHELIAGKSISPSTHRVNWVPVFVWDDGGGRRPTPRSSTHAADVWAHAIRFCDEPFVLLVLVCLKQRTDILNKPINRKRSRESAFCIHSAEHGIYCTHGLLQESSCSNTGFVCKITYCSFWRNNGVRVDSGSLL